MARSYRRRGYSRTYRRSRWPYRSWRRFSVFSAQTQGTRRFNVVVPIEGQIGIPFAAGNATSETVIFNPFYSTNAQSVDSFDYWNHYGTLVTNNLFLTYTSLYDQVKINSMSVSLAVMSLPQGSACKIYTSVDRFCNFKDLVTAHPLANVLSSGEVYSSQFTSLDRAKMYRRFVARDIGERTTFVDTSMGSSGVGNPVQYTRTALSEFLSHTLGTAFCPCVYMAVQMPGANNTGSIVTATVAYTVKWSLTFRNPKYAISGNSKFSDMKNDVVEDLKSGIDEELPDPDEEVKKGSKKFDELSDEEKARIMELIGSMEDEKGA